MQVRGEVASGFETVRKAFEAGAADLGQGGGAFAAYVDGTKVVELWAGEAAAGREWERDTRAVIMSTTKGFVALCAHILYDRGLLDVEAPVASYWPEFAQNGKDAVTVRQVLNHTAGIVGIPGHERELGWDGSGWHDTAEIASWIASSPLAWEPGTKHGYHALTFGWIIGELVRRIDGRSLGTFFRDEVAHPLGVNARIGTPRAEQDGIAAVIQDPQDVRERQLNEMLAELPEEVVKPLLEMTARTRDDTSPIGQAFVARDGTSILDVIAEFMASPEGLAAEIGSSNGTSSAGDLARVFALLACGGELDGARFVSPRSLEVFSTKQVEGPDAILGVQSCWALGYMYNWAAPGMPKRFGPSERAIGHAGAGGQLGFADLDRKVSVGFVRSHLAMVPVLSVQLIDALYDCLA